MDSSYSASSQHTAVIPGPVRATADAHSGGQPRADQQQGSAAFLSNKLKVKDYRKDVLSLLPVYVGPDDDPTLTVQC